MADNQNGASAIPSITILPHMYLTKHSIEKQQTFSDFTSSLLE